MFACNGSQQMRVEYTQADSQSPSILASPRLPSRPRALKAPTFYIPSGPLHQESLRAFPRQRPRPADAGTFRKDPRIALHGIFTAPEHSWSWRATAVRVQYSNTTSGPDKRNAQESADQHALWKKRAGMGLRQRPTQGWGILIGGAQP